MLESEVVMLVFVAESFGVVEVRWGVGLPEVGVVFSVLCLADVLSSSFAGDEELSADVVVCESFVA